MTVVQHGAIDYTRMLDGILLKIAVVGRNYAKRLFAVELIQQGFGNGRTNLRLRAATKLIDEKQRFFIAVFKKKLHIEQVRTVSRQVVFDGLFIANIDKNVVEYAYAGIFFDRYRQAALNHILQQTDGFEANRFSPGIGTGDNEYAVLSVQCNIQRHYLTILFLQRQIQQRVNGLHPVDFGTIFHHRFYGMNLPGKFGFCTNKIDPPQKLVSFEQIGQKRTQIIGKIRQNAYNLAPFLIFQFTNAIIGFYHLRRFDIYGFPRCRFVVNNASDPTFVRGVHRNYQSPVAHGRRYIPVDKSFGLGVAQNGVENFGDAVHGSGKPTTNIGQLWRSTVFYLSGVVQKGVDLFDQVGIHHHISG